MANTYDSPPENRPAVKVKPDADDFTQAGGPGVLPPAKPEAAPSAQPAAQPAQPAQPAQAPANRPATPATLG